MDEKYINYRNIWEKANKNKGLIIPTILFAFLVVEDKKFIVYEDSSTIIYMIGEGKGISYCIPKKYCRISGEKEKKYIITNIKKLTPISCLSKNKYEKFVIKNLLNL